MCESSIEAGKVILMPEAGREAQLAGFALDLLTPLYGSNSATPDATGYIERPLAYDVFPDQAQSLLGRIALI